MSDVTYDAVIVGGGPAGMAAALTLGRVHRRTLLVDAGHGRNAAAEQVHNFWTRDGTAPGDLRRLGGQELGSYASVQQITGTVENVVARPGGRFQLALADGTSVVTRRILLATGLTDEVPELVGAEGLWGRSAFHCPYCHGYECTGKAVAVLGSEPARVRLALQLSRFAADVVLCTDGAPVDRGSGTALESAGVTVVDAAVKRLVGDDGVLDRIEFADGSTLSPDAVFVQNVPRQRARLAEALGCAALADGCVEIDEFGQTSVPGVYAAGDTAHRPTLPMPLASVITAAASGTLAGSVIDQDLLSEDFGLANPFAAAGR